MSASFVNSLMQYGVQGMLMGTFPLMSQNEIESKAREIVHKTDGLNMAQLAALSARVKNEAAIIRQYEEAGRGSELALRKKVDLEEVITQIRECCWTCGKSKKDSCMSRCSRCATALYCNQDCQRNDWLRHKKVDCIQSD